MPCSTARLAFSFFLVCSAAFAAADTAHWPRWRGPEDNGTLATAKLPRSVDASQVLWKTSLPGKGFSTPIVWKQQIYLTAPVQGKDAVLAFDMSGRQLWQTAFSDEVKGRHRNGSGSNPSPVTDGNGIFVTFKSGNLAALNLDGTIRWQANLAEKFGPVKLFWDFGTSPVLTEKNVVMARMHEGESWLAAFDKQTGEMRWKTARNYETPREVDNGYTTPIVIRYQDREALLTWGAAHLTIHDADEGKLLWSCGDFDPTATPFWPAVASPLVVGEMAVVPFGRADKGQPRLHGIRLAGRGDVTATNRIWKREDVSAFVPSPAEYQGRVYVLSDRGQLECLEPNTGKTIWSEALPRSSSNYYASPLIAGGIMYAAREDGAVFVIQVEDGFRLLSETKFADKIIASIVPAGNRLLIRGEANLYCVAGE
jgi:outer membrane protein assembly factor BamB